MILNDAVRQALTAGHLAHLVTLNSDGSPHISIVWVGLDGDEIVCAHLGSWKKVKNIQQDDRVSLSMVTGGKTGLLENYLVISGRARITEVARPNCCTSLLRYIWDREVIFHPPIHHRIYYAYPDRTCSWPRSLANVNWERLQVKL